MMTPVGHHQDIPDFARSARSRPPAVAGLALVVLVAVTVAAVALYGPVLRVAGLVP